MAQPASNPVPIWEPPDPEHLAAVLPGYAVLALIGSGGMGAVYRAKQKSLGRFVALKILSPEVAGRAPEFAVRFNNEAAALAKLSHPGIAHLFDCGRTKDDQLFIATEFVEGRDVGQIMAGKQALPVKQALFIAISVCTALEHAHQRGVIHRDIKPANVIVDGAGRVKITDFGLARILQAAVPGDRQTTSLLGTPRFTAPEALVPAAKIDARSDLFSAGVLLFQMLTGEVPRGEAPPPSEWAEGIDRRLDAIVAQAMAYDPVDRYPSAASLLEALEDFRRTTEAENTAVARQEIQAETPLPAPTTRRAAPPASWEEPVHEEDVSPVEERSFPVMAWMSTLVVVGIAGFWAWQQWKHPSNNGSPRLAPAASSEATAAKQSNSSPAHAPASTKVAVAETLPAAPSPTLPKAATAASQAASPIAPPAPVPTEGARPIVPPDELAETQRRIAQIQADFDTGVKEWQAAQNAKFDQLDVQYLRAVKNAIVAMRNERRLADHAALQEEERYLTSRTPLPPHDPLAAPERARLRDIYEGQVRDIAIAGAEAKVEIYNRLLGSLFAYQSILRQTNKTASADIVAAIMDRSVAERDGMRAALKAAPAAP